MVWGDKPGMLSSATGQCGRCRESPAAGAGIAQWDFVSVLCGQ